ncbi:hypothetical protein AYO09_00265 [Klebsiella pneumoniae]|nr:hypothetical protein AYO09_00265 [Klebsiella pneumoniae]
MHRTWPAQRTIAAGAGANRRGRSWLRVAIEWESAFHIFTTLIYKVLVIRVKSTEITYRLTVSLAAFL